MPTAYERLRALKGEKAVEFRSGQGEFLLCPDMGARVFAQLGGVSLHRIDLEAAARPTREFNNYGGLNLWPAPEGGKFGFNYEGDTWRVQDAVNLAPFELARASETGGVAGKEVVLENRMGTRLPARIERRLEIVGKPSLFDGLACSACAACETSDTIRVAEPVSAARALIAAWTLEQFDANEECVAFCRVDNPRDAINFDYYEHPGERIGYRERGFTYRVDGRKAGQIGVKASAGAAFIGCCDPRRGLLCVRENLSREGGTHFNIADNDQPGGPYSAADNYSVFNSGEDMNAFELETVGAADIQDGEVAGSALLSRTAFALVERAEAERFMSEALGGPA